MKFTNVETGEVTDLRFIAGLFGVYESDQGLAPEIGWAIVHGDEKGNRFSMEETYASDELDTWLFAANPDKQESDV